MDDFVRTVLKDCDLSELIPKFQENRIDKESLYCLEEKDIDQLILPLGPRVKFRKRVQSLMKHGDAAESVQDLPSTSDKGKRKLNPQSAATKDQSPAKRRITESRASTEGAILDEVKRIMKDVNEKLEKQDDTDLKDFLMNRISDLETDKRELVGVFGRTGAGKSSLINAIVGEKKLLPSGRGSACTSVMIKVEANRHNSKYVAEIEFISKEAWKEELWSLNQRDNAGQKNEDNNDDEYHDLSEKLSAVYGEEWKDKSPESLMASKYFREVPGFWNDMKKTFTCDSAQELSEEFAKYTRSDSADDEGERVKRLYWPLVKCVTIKVPNNSLLQHVTLVDLPGNGDCNKSRDMMWKEIVGSCSTVWIVADIDRAKSDRDPWAIVKSAIYLMGNGGECQTIHFICTKSDQIDDSEVPAAEVPALILKENEETKQKVKKELSKQVNIKKHFKEDCFEVYTVSSREFLNSKHLQPDDTEIPKLKDFLKDLNDSHSVTLNYVSGAFGILSLIQGACCSKDTSRRNPVCTELETNVKITLGQVRSSMEEAYKCFERSLAEGVEKSKISCEEKLNSVLYPNNSSGSAFHKTLSSVVKKDGSHITGKGQEINLNITLSSCLTDSIDEDFRKTFPNNIKAGPFNGAISKVSLHTESLIEKNTDLELQLSFLKMEEDKIKSKVNKKIRDCKKIIYLGLTETIKNSMQEGYRRAATFKGEDKLRKMRDEVSRHFDLSKNSMFDEAKKKMLEQLDELKVEILETIEETMMKALELSLKNDDRSIQDVSKELKMVKEHLDQLKNNS